MTIRRFATTLDYSNYKLLYLPDSKLTPRHFYKGMLEQLECEFYRGDSKSQLHREIELMRGIHGIAAICCLDEAHLLDRKTIEEVRFLQNFRMDAQNPMALILAGQSELWDRLRLQSYTAIRQRIDLQCKLPHYDRDQSGEYIKRHHSYAGSEQFLIIEYLSKCAGGVLMHVRLRSAARLCGLMIILLGVTGCMFNSEKQMTGTMMVHPTGQPDIPFYVFKGTSSEGFNDDYPLCYFSYHYTEKYKHEIEQLNDRDLIVKFALSNSMSTSESPDGMCSWIRMA